MSEAIQLGDYIDETRTESYPSGAVARKSGGSGGDMDDVLKRLGAVESSLSDLRVQVSGIAAKIPYLATKADVLATKADVLMLKADVNAMETKIIKWMIATTLTAVGLAFTIAKFVH
jgi:hypothetical protein